MSLKMAKRMECCSCRRHWRQERIYTQNCRRGQRQLQRSVRNSLFRRDSEFLLEKLQALDQGRQSLPLAFVVKRAQTLISFVLAAFAIRKLVSRETFVVTVRARQRRRFRVTL